jgi:hypothetical protein
MGTTPHELIYGIQLAWIKHLNSSGEIAVVKYQTNVQSNIKNRGFPGMLAPQKIIMKMFILFGIL